MHSENTYRSSDTNLNARATKRTHNPFEDLGALEGLKPELLSLIKGVAPDPMPGEKVGVIADLILTARSLRGD